MGVGKLIGKIFGSGESAAPGALPLRAYGKLALYSEYRRLELAPGLPTAFSRWLDEGRLAWMRGAATREAGVVQSSRVIFRAADSREVVVASVWDSRDSLGRIFPFSFFVACPVEALGATSAQRWVSALSLFRSFDRAHAELSTLGAGGDFYRQYRQRTLTISTDDLDPRVATIRADAARPSAAEWFDGAGFESRLPIDQWLGGLLYRARRWKSQPQLAQELAISCPLSSGAPPGVQVLMWLDWLEPLIARVGRTPIVVAPDDANVAGRRLSILLREAMPDDFQLLTSDEPSYGFVEHLDQSPTAPAGGAPDAVPPPGGSLAQWFVENAVRP